MSIPEREDANYFDNVHVKELSARDFDQFKSSRLNNKKCCIVLFYAPWCGYCKKVRPEYEKMAKKNKFMDVYAFNCEKNKAHIEKIKNDLPNLVRGYPTIVAYKNGEPSETFEDERTAQELLKFAMRVCE